MILGLDIGVKLMIPTPSELPKVNSPDFQALKHWRKYRLRYKWRASQEIGE